MEGGGCGCQMTANSHADFFHLEDLKDGTVQMLAVIYYNARLIQSGSFQIEVDLQSHLLEVANSALKDPVGQTEFVVLFHVTQITTNGASL